MGDLVMRRLNDEARHPALKPMLDDGRRHHREGVATVFAPQLARVRGAARAQLLDILIVATDVYVWKLLRRDFGLGRAAAEAIVRKISTASSIGRRKWHGYSGSTGRAAGTCRLASASRACSRRAGTRSPSRDGRRWCRGSRPPGFRAIEFTDAYAQVDRYPQGHFLTRMSCYLTSPAVEAQVDEVVAAERPDLVLIDAMFPAALARASGFGRRPRYSCTPSCSASSTCGGR